ncbi:hypothetical protein SAMN05216570_1566 [Dyella sp. OK004]|uniref:hypothetical protein n=1 Tax=Dyella sp. OK004 TaxID=1855292 RepID=UPI0008EC8CFE|nr:hypothetical protein [Dyella sp. OK004]SFS01833.1 hypothetical protein SAMN05216570_1566 [Dyella sp. OK004]
MSSLPSRLALIILSGGLVLAGCADKTTRPTTTSATSGSSSTTTTQGTTTRSSGTAVSKPRPAKAATQALPDNTGVQACDDYLASYMACHQAAGIYAPDQIEGRYEAMRNSLLKDSLDPTIRPQLERRCTSLASQLHQALHGKACAAGPATATSSAQP